MTLFRLSSSKARWAALLLALGAPAVVVHAQQDAPKKEISDKVSEQLGKLRELTDAKNFDAALKLINDLMQRAQPNSYDMAVLAQVKAQVLITQNQYAASIEPLELAHRLGETYNFFDAKQLQDLKYYLAQLYYQEALAVKDPAQQRPGMDKALDYLRRYLETNANPNPEAQLFAASLMYNRAMLDPNNVDNKLLNDARAQAEKGLYLGIKPREGFYVLMLAVLQQQGRNEEAAELLELLVKQYPTNKQYWQSLAGAYLSLAGASEDPEVIEDWTIRAIITFERAQQLGILTEPSNHFNLIGLYFNIQRFDQAIDLLEKGLANGNIESTQRNWELLASSYQQVRKELKAIDILKEATKRFPDAGQLEYTIAQTYYTLDKMPEAFKHAQAALRKGNLDKASTVQMFAAYVGYELREYEEALKLAEAAAKDPESENAEKLATAIREAIAEREAAINAKVF